MVKFVEYIKYLLKYKDGRFGRHPRFRYVAFNVLMRRQSDSNAGFYVRQNGAHPEGGLTIDELGVAFDEDTPEAEALVNSITRFSGNLRGTRPFWGGAVVGNLRLLCKTAVDIELSMLQIGAKGQHIPTNT